MSAKFLRHEGYLGAVGAYLKVHPMPAPPTLDSEGAQGKVAFLLPLLSWKLSDVQERSSMATFDQLHENPLCKEKQTRASNHISN